MKSFIKISNQQYFVFEHKKYINTKFNLDISVNQQLELTQKFVKIF